MPFGSVASSAASRGADERDAAAGTGAGTCRRGRDDDDVAEEGDVGAASTGAGAGCAEDSDPEDAAPRAPKGAASGCPDAGGAWGSGFRDRRGFRGRRSVGRRRIW